MVKTRYSYSVGEYDKEGRKLHDRMKSHVVKEHITMSALIRKCFAHYEDTVINKDQKE